MRKFLLSLWEIFEIAFVTVATVLIIRGYLVQPFLVSGSSMRPNFTDGDYLLVDQITYRLRSPERGEVIVFHYPGDPTQQTYFIKRIIGLPNERVVVSGGHVTVYNSAHPAGFELTEDYLPKGTITDHDIDTTLKPQEYLVFGDNRSFSFDSRSWGVLDRNEIVGLARVRLWPISTLTAFAAPQY
jgi:signal peptidase I